METKQELTLSKEQLSSIANQILAIVQPRLEGRIETIVTNLRADMAEVESKANDAATTVEWFLQDQAEELTNKSSEVETRIEVLEREIAHLRQSA